MCDPPHKLAASPTRATAFVPSRDGPWPAATHVPPPQAMPDADQLQSPLPTRSPGRADVGVGAGGPAVRAAAAGHVQFGCGHCAPPTWRNFDASPTLRFERVPVFGRLYTKNARRFPPGVEYGDILRGLPVAPGSCAAVFSSHVLQDLTLAESRVALRHTFAMLRPGGVYRTVVPDLAVAVRRYVESRDPLAAYHFLRETKTGLEAPVPRRAKVAAALGSRQQWQWDFASLAHELRAAGFGDVRRCEIGDAADPAFADVEDPTRFANALAVEGVRP